MSQHWRRLFVKENADFSVYSVLANTFHRFSHEFFHCGFFQFFHKIADCVTKLELPPDKSK
jgi:hypothetical protein